MDDGLPEAVPAHVLTNNALVARSSFQAIGGFDEAFPLAGAEAIDLTYQLAQCGPIGYQPKPVLTLDMMESWLDFCEQNWAYGPTCRLLAAKYHWEVSIPPIPPLTDSLQDRCIARRQNWLMRWGFWSGGWRLRTHGVRPARQPKVILDEPLSEQTNGRIPVLLEHQS